MGCAGCKADAGSWNTYIQCNGLTPQPLADQNTMMTIAAQNGASSSGALNWTMCMAMVFLITRRFPYWKNAPGDCGNAGTYTFSGTDAGISAGLKTAAITDPEPISKGILTGFSVIAGLFGAAHQQAVINEQSTLCNVAGSFNQSMQYLEQYVKSGAMTTDQASATLSQIAQQLDQALAGIAKTASDAAAGYRIALRALVAFMEQIGFLTLAPQNSIQALAPTAPIANAGEPGTSGVSTGGLPYVPPAPNLNPSGLVTGGTSITGYQGASGPISQPMNANNPGIGSTGSINSPLPTQFDPGTLVIIGGVAFVASKLGRAA